jgi:subtilisin-like proprotein convertase family protein
LFLVHPDVTTLTVTLTNPIGHSVPVAADAVGGEIVFDGAVSGFSGDEPVNGRWVLSIEDGVDGDAGELLDYVLRIGSRDD